MTVHEPAPVATESQRAVVERYEQLRCRARGSPGAGPDHGLALLMARGMAAWMRAWSCPAPLPPVAERARAVRTSSSALDAEVACLLADMVLAAVVEGPPT